MLLENFGKNIAEVRGQREVAAFVELFGGEAGPLAVDFAAVDGAAGNEKGLVRLSYLCVALPPSGQ